MTATSFLRNTQYATRNTQYAIQTYFTKFLNTVWRIPPLR